MKTFNRIAIAALLAGGAIIAATAPANAHVDVSISVGGSVFAGDYDYDRPCTWYRYWNLPAPGRCYRAYWGFYGPNVYIVDGFVVCINSAAPTGTTTAGMAAIMTATMRTTTTTIKAKITTAIDPARPVGHGLACRTIRFEFGRGYHGMAAGGLLRS
jgi:hypothetical protein